MGIEAMLVDIKRNVSRLTQMIHANLQPLVWQPEKLIPDHTDMQSAYVTGHFEVTVRGLDSVFHPLL